MLKMDPFYLIAFIAFAVVAFIVIAKVASKYSKKRERGSIEYPYTRKDPLFSAAERSFFGVLNLAIDNETQIFGKVRVADVITPKKGETGGAQQAAFNKISSKHFDFLLCKKSDLSVLCAVELNDRSHDTKKRRERDAFLQKACNSAKIALVQIKAKRTYNVGDIRAVLSPYLPSSLDPGIPPLGDPVETTEKIHRAPSLDNTCPKCSSKMFMKVLKGRGGVDTEFWICNRFPECNHIEKAVN